MTINEVRNYYGSFYKATRALCMSVQTPRNWKRYGYIPIQTQVRIEFLTKGALKANLDHCGDRVPLIETKDE